MKTENIGNDTRKYAKKAAESSESMAQDFVDSAKRTYDQVLESTSEFLSPAGHYVTDWNSKATSLVRSYPIQTAIGGIVVGYLLGSALKRPRSTD